jgi:hypothetical protein
VARDSTSVVFLLNENLNYLVSVSSVMTKDKENRVRQDTCVSDYYLFVVGGNRLMN